MPIIQIVDGRLAVLVDEPTGGLLVDVPDSIGHRLAVVEKHLDNGEMWQGKDPVDNFFNRDSLDAFRLTAGNGGAYGTEVQISNGDEIEGGDASKRYDMERIFIKDVGTADKLYKIELYGGTGTFEEAEWLTEVLYMAPSNQINSGPADMVADQIPCNYKIWARCKSEQDGGTIDFLPGILLFA